MIHLNTFVTIYKPNSGLLFSKHSQLSPQLLKGLSLNLHTNIRNIGTQVKAKIEIIIVFIIFYNPSRYLPKLWLLLGKAQKAAFLVLLRILLSPIEHRAYLATQ